MSDRADSTRAFLGEDPSFHHKVPKGFFPFITRRSLDSLKSKPVSLTLRMPTLTGKLNYNQFFDGIESNAWMVPHVMACLNIKLNRVNSLQSTVNSRPFHLPRSVASAPTLPSISEESSEILPLCDHIRPLEETVSAFSAERTERLTYSMDICPSNSLCFKASSWRAVGVVFMCNEPAWNVFETRFVALMDNFLFECKPESDAILGFVPLSGAHIILDTLEIPVACSTVNERQGDISVEHRTNKRETVQIPALEVYYLKHAQPQSERKKIWMYCGTPKETLLLRDLLIRAASLSEHDLYDMAVDIHTLKKSGSFYDNLPAIPSDFSSSLPAALRPRVSYCERQRD